MNDGQASGGRSVRRPTVSLITQALNEAKKEAVELYRKAGLHLAIWREGRVQLVAPESVEESLNQLRPERP